MARSRQGRESDRPSSADLRRAVDATAARQHGVATRRQLVDLGLSPHVVDARLRDGRLRRIHHAVYQVGPLLPSDGRAMAAALACGPAAAVSHGSAAVLWELARGPHIPKDEVHVLTTGESRSRPGIRVHRTRSLRPVEVTRLRGIPLTTVPRTLLDLAGDLDPRILERRVAEALATRLTTMKKLRRQLSLRPTRPGAPKLRRLLDGGPPLLTRSEAEERLLTLVRKTPLPAPRTNVRIEGLEVDFLWRAERLVVEVDGRAAHGSPGAFESDRRRDAMLAAAGYRVVRVTWRQLVKEPEAVLVRLAMALVRGGGPAR